MGTRRVGLASWLHDTQGLKRQAASSWESLEASNIIRENSHFYLMKESFFYVQKRRQNNNQTLKLIKRLASNKTSVENTEVDSRWEVPAKARLPSHIHMITELCQYRDFTLETTMSQRDEAGEDLQRWQKEGTDINPGHFHIHFLT